MSGGLHEDSMSINCGSAACKVIRQVSTQGMADAEGNLARTNDRKKRRVALPAISLLLAMHFLLNPCEARSYRLTSPGRRQLLTRDVDESPPVGRFSLVMFHRDHDQSPLRNSQVHNLTFAQRIHHATIRSSQRTESIRHKIRMALGKGLNGSSTNNHRTRLLEFQSPVFAQQGEYLASINLGTPGKKFVMILDSGSDLAWVQCKPCKPCISNMPDALFDPSRSSTYHNLPCANALCNDLPSPSPICTGSTCPFVYQYGDGTTASGEFATDTIAFGVASGRTGTIPDFAFGCGTDNSGDLAGSDGVLGIGKGAFSLTSQLRTSVGNKFSFCLVSVYEATTKTSPFVIGNGSFAYAAGCRWTPIVRNDNNPSFYYVHVDGIMVGGKALKGVPSSTFVVDSITGNGGTIIDTGTTITELLPPAYNVLVSIVTSEVPYPTVDGSDYGFDLCWDTSKAPKSGPVLPSIIFQFRWADFDLPPDSAYVEVDTNVFCLCFASGSGVNIVGNVHLQNFHMFVNNDDNMLGWKHADCDKVK